MQRSIATTLPTVATSKPKQGEATALPVRRSAPRWLLVGGFWTLIVLAYSTRGEVRVGPYQWVSLSWFDAFKAAAAQWYVWGLLSVAIYWVNRKLPVASDALLKRLLLHVPLSIVFTVAYTYLNNAAMILTGAPEAPPWLGATLIDTVAKVTYRQGTFVYWAIAMICVALDYQSDLRDREVRTAGLERLLSEARLSMLRSQLDPHFLFNTLNSISAYVESAPGQARLMLEQLGDLLRLSLEHADQQEIPLERELTFVDRYIQLQLVRFADRLQVKRPHRPGGDDGGCPHLPAAAAPRERDPPRHVETQRRRASSSCRRGAAAIASISGYATTVPGCRAAGHSTGTSASVWAIRVLVSNSSTEKVNTPWKWPRTTRTCTWVDITFPFRVA